MMEHLDYLSINRKLWNERTRHHLASDFYDVDRFLKGANSLKQIELDLLGDVTGKTILHLQCHFGQDSLSLARMGGTVTGVDLADEAIKAARSLSEQMDAKARFICCDIYDLPNHLNEKFDIVFTTYGTIGWFPDLDKWAALIANYLQPGGSLIFADFHPVVWMFDSSFSNIQYSYFNVGPIIEQEEGTYADAGAAISLQSVGWNHPLDEVIAALLRHGLALQHFREYDHSPYNVFSNMVEVAPGKFQLTGKEGKLPLVYSLVCIK